MQGTVMFARNSGWGFIASGSRSYFFHIKNTIGNTLLKESDTVSFEVRQSTLHKSKDEAFNVTLIEPTPGASEVLS